MKSSERTFRRKVLNFYKTHGRHHLPWRKTRDPYHILVSEMMLQQTQVSRVIPKYTQFLERFPTAQTLSDAKLSEVLKLWSGLGYNRRARMLHEAVKLIQAEYKGSFPKSVQELEKLPGVGSYTARAILVFAYNEPVVMLETNIRSAFLHEFFKNTSGVLDAQVLSVIEACVDTKNSREWYAALMDYGSHVKKAYQNPGRRSKHHIKQSKFRGSLREVRGKILSLLVERSHTETLLTKETGCSSERVRDALLGLSGDGLVVKKGRNWTLAT
ncbi:endonuclease III [bacterium]|nr:endonuclease III [bacterium]